MTIALPAQPVRPVHKIDLSWPILILFAAVLCVLIVLPMSWLIYYSLVDRSGAFTLDNFKKLVLDDAFLDPLITTVILATSSSIICGAVGRRRWDGWWRAPTCRCAAPCGHWSPPHSSRHRFSAPSRGSCSRRRTAG